jgi:hypothetical protein
MGTLEVVVKYKGDYFGSTAQAMEVPDVYYQAFQPLAKSDDPFLGAILGEATELEARVVYKLRRDAAEDLARTLTEALLREMAKADTINGYPIEAG